jgi:hypothetical protein
MARSLKVLEFHEILIVTAGVKKWKKKEKKST